MRRVLRERSVHPAVSWVGIVTVLVAIVYSVVDGRIAWSLFGVGLAAALLVPPVGFRSLRATPPGPLTLLAAAAFVVGAIAPEGTVAGLAAYAAIAAVALVVVAEIDAFTPVRTNRGFAVVLVVMTTMTTAGAWELTKWIYDWVAGTSLVASNDAVMWQLIAATAAGLIAAVVFDLYLRRFGDGEFVPEEFSPEDAGEQVDAVGESVTETLESIGLSAAWQRRLVRFAQATLAVFVLVGVVTLNLNVVVNASIGLAATFLPTVLERDPDVDLDAGLALWIAVSVTFHSMGTLYLYQRLYGWHNVAHVVTGTVIAAIGYTTVRALEAHTDSLSFPPKFTFLVVVLFVFSMGVFWEIVEFTLDGIAGALGTGGLVLAQHGLQDTMSDLLADTAGAVLVAGAATLYRRPDGN